MGVSIPGTDRVAIAIALGALVEIRERAGGTQGLTRLTLKKEKVIDEELSATECTRHLYIRSFATRENRATAVVKKPYLFSYIEKNGQFSSKRPKAGAVRRSG